jgi:hypothetical protein
MSTETQAREGWGCPPASRKFHYFREGMSLCGKWGFAFHLPLEQGQDDHSENCADCKRRRAKEVAAS